MLPTFFEETKRNHCCHNRKFFCGCFNENSDEAVKVSGADESILRLSKRNCDEGCCCCCFAEFETFYEEVTFQLSLSCASSWWDILLLRPNSIKPKGTITFNSWGDETEEERDDDC